MLQKTEEFERRRYLRTLRGLRDRLDSAKMQAECQAGAEKARNQFATEAYALDWALVDIDPEGPEAQKAMELQEAVQARVG